MKRIAILLLLFCSFAAAQHSVTLTWYQSVSAGVTGNKVYRSTLSGGPYAVIYTSTTQVTTYQDTAVVGNGLYYYVVTATCSTCSPVESGYSNQVTAQIPPDTQPNAPSNLTVHTAKLERNELDQAGRTANCMTFFVPIVALRPGGLMD